MATLDQSGRARKFGSGEGRITKRRIHTLGAAANTVAADEILKGYLSHPDGGSAVTDTMPTAALLVAAIHGAEIGDTITCYYKNLDGADAMTIAVGTGGTLRAGTATVAAGTGTLLTFILTNVTASSEAYDLFLSGEQ